MLSKTEFIMLKILTLTFLSIISCGILIGEKPYELTVEKIMQDPKWLGTSPSNIHWSEDSKWIYFKWNPKGTTSDSLYKVSPKGGEPIKVSQKDRIVLPSKDGDYTKDFMKKVYEKNGDIFLLNIKSDKRTQITKTITLESSPLFSSDEKSITYISNGNLFKWEINTGSTIQMTDFKKYQKIQDDPISDQQQWLKDEELDLIKTINNQRLEMEEKELILKAEKPKRPLSIIHGEKIIQSILLSPNEKIITFHTFDPSPNIERTIVPNYVTATGFTKNLDAREKVGRQDGKYEFGIYNIMNMTVNEKIKEIAILKAMGYSGRDIVIIFLTQSIVIGLVGGILGLVLGYIISVCTGYIPFRIATSTTLPINFNTSDYVLGFVFGIVITFLAGYFPASKASKVDPVTIIRG